MAGSSLLDFDLIRQPIPGDAPTGPDLRRDPAAQSPYRQLKDARLAARQQDDRAGWDDEGAGLRPDWGPVLEMAPQLLATQSKDLDVACWLLEGLVRQHGFAGLRDGLRLYRELVENFWDELHPMPEPDEAQDDDIPRRLIMLAQLDGGAAPGPLITALRDISLVQPGEAGPLGLAAYEKAASIARLTDPAERQRRFERGAVSPEAFNAAMKATPPQFHKALHDDLQAATDELRKLEETLAARCGDRSPSLANVRNTLTACQQRIPAFAGAADSDGQPALAAATGQSASASVPAAVTGPIRSREQAFAVILEAARFFRQTEPHSVLSWQLEECVRFGRMSLPELLTELVGDTGVRDGLFKRVGIPVPAEQGG